MSRREFLGILAAGLGATLVPGAATGVPRRIGLSLPDSMALRAYEIID